MNLSAIFQLFMQDGFSNGEYVVLLHSYYQTRIIFQQADTMDDGVNFHYEWIQTLVAEWHE